MATLALPAGIETDGAIRLFNKWSYDDVEVKDISLIDYIQVKAPVYLPHTAGRFASKRFRKAQCPIVERLTNSLMMHGRNNGKKLMAVRIVKHAFEIIHLLSDQNPIQVLVDAIINTGPREDSTRIGSAGTVRRQAVDVSPLRRVNQAVSLLTIGTRESAFRNVKSIAECLADELINAAKGSSNSYAIKKKDELERVAKSNSQAEESIPRPRNLMAEYDLHNVLRDWIIKTKNGLYYDSHEGKDVLEYRTEFLRRIEEYESRMIRGDQDN
ncbi:ribosomal protein S5 [Linnemannia hyalina]|uniref:Ribosomal protein S5 n=1 Tax=Linnemannia hyalina TaxID=64524 RepID=A0A9P8BUB1_9FUNG|nr:ribosomal protein S5 [Linnemannia hyalina]